ncbi:hypothetical protein [uncultured Paraglaciecola sp.]|uniref:hypothetical protein n=1 Tax=uncultured Paraglaciecola sp. TaxID=1765024 RepID=UPI002620B7B7|nr:hypothetical protein [uncultured Paraglaciecola sp.]
MKFLAKYLIIMLFFCCAGVVNASDSYIDPKDDDVISSNIVSYNAKHREADRLLVAIKSLYEGQLLFSVVKDKIYIRGDVQISAEAIAVLKEMDQPERYFRLRLSQTKPSANTKTYSTNQSVLGHNQSFAMTNNKPLLISKRNETQRLSAGGLLWYQTDTVVNKEQTIELSIRALTADRAELSYRISHVNQDDKQLQVNTVVVPLNKWVSLSAKENDNRHWSTAKTSTNKSPTNDLFIKLETY